MLGAMWVLCRAPHIKEHRGLFETYLSKLEKARKHGKTCFMVSSIGGTTNNSVRKKWLNDLVIMELNFCLFKLETIIQVLSHERSDRQAKLKFTDEFSSMTSDLCNSLNSMFVDLINPVDPDEDIAHVYLREEELRLCLEGEEKMRCEHQKLIVEENRIRLDEAKRLRLEEENMLQLEQQKKNKRKEFMNSNHCKNLLSKLAPAKRIQLCSFSEKIQPKVRYFREYYTLMDISFVSDDIETFSLGQSWQINGWLLDPARKGWLTEELLLQNGMPLFYANGERDFQLVRDTYVSCQHLMVRCKERHEQILELQNLVGSTIVAESVRLLQKFQQDDLESSRGMMRLICKTQLKVLEKLSFIALLRRQ
ncbi:hypothetical protein Tco_1113766 [Tanacetum coccineum]|uniref:Uncharacterized protein n=1 Tax=Tanacetum coccineum TaxID=301880 RepID=A0ABQ5IT42_9ASTR